MGMGMGGDGDSGSCPDSEPGGHPGDPFTNRTVLSDIYKYFGEKGGICPRSKVLFFFLS